MEVSSSSKVKDKPEASAFFCHLCSISCASALNLQTHFLGIKHKKVENAIRNYKKEKKDETTTGLEPPTTTLQEHVDACKDSEPAVGLEYIYQFRKLDHSTYECKLCECHSGMTHMFMHIVGAKHRLNYLCKHHPKLDTFGPYIPTGPKKIGKLKEICIKVEKEFGRQKINVLDGTRSQWSFSTGASSVYYDPDSELNQMDFTSDDIFGTSNKPKASEHIITFLELKAAHEADKSAASSDDIAHNTGESEEVKPGNDTEQEIKDTEEESREESCEEAEEVPSEEPCESFQDFTSNKDLLDFLEHFRILEIDDATFLIRAVEILSIALIQYQSEKMLCVPIYDDPKEQQKSQKPDLAPPVVPPKQDPKTQSTKPLFPISQCIEIEPLSQRNKLLFTVSSNKAEESTSNFDPTTNIFKKKDPQVNKETPSAKTTFAPPGAHLPPGPAPPVLPILKNDVVKTFFESIKNMEVAEVVTTLNKITATNPAFKGIHVPSLVRYLTETGKLKSGKSVQQQTQ